MGLFGKKKPSVDMTYIRANCKHHIYYTGLERGDVVMVLAKIGAGIGLKVAILDNSRTHDIFGAFDDGTGDRVINRGFITVIKDAYEPDEYQRKELGYDVIFSYYGYNNPSISEDETGAYAITAVAPDRLSIEAAAKARDKFMKFRRAVIYRDADKNLSVMDICHLLKITDKKQVMVVRFDRNEMISYSKYTRDLSWPLVKFIKTSGEAVSYMAKEIYCITDKQIPYCVKKGDET